MARTKVLFKYLRSFWSDKTNISEHFVRRKGIGVYTYYALTQWTKIFNISRMGPSFLLY